MILPTVTVATTTMMIIVLRFVGAATRPSGGPRG
jgi:hypothetical protein